MILKEIKTIYRLGNCDYWKLSLLSYACFTRTLFTIPPEVFTWMGIPDDHGYTSLGGPCQSAAGLEMNGAKFGLV